MIGHVVVLQSMGKYCIEGRRAFLPNCALIHGGRQWDSFGGRWVSCGWARGGEKRMEQVGWRKWSMTS